MTLFRIIVILLVGLSPNFPCKSVYKEIEKKFKGGKNKAGGKGL